MEEDTEGLDLLIKQKKKRPNYARVISMEFSNSSTQQSVKRTSVNKGRIAQGASCSISSDGYYEDCFDSDGNEYFSAEEFIQSSSSSSISSDEESSLGQSSDSVFESLDSSFRSNMSLSDPYGESQSLETTQGTKSFEIKHRAPSKKQKRKRRLTSNDFDLQFFGFSSFDIGINDLKFDAFEFRTIVSKPVPSLVDLCINAARKIPKTITGLNVPKAVRQILQIGNSDHSFHHLQVDYLLKLLEFSSLDIEHVGFVTKLKQLFPRRNVWSFDSTQFLDNGKISVEYLPSIGNVLGEKLDEWQDFHLFKFLFNRGRQLSVLAHVMDMLLPGQLSGIKTNRRQHKSDADNCSTEMDNRFKGFKQMIQNRFVKICKEGGLDDNTFNIILPYVCWARGDIKKASQGFLSLVEKETRVRYKALFLYEAGRMLSHFDDSEAAMRYFNLASEAILTKGKHNKTGIPEQVDRQTRILSAAVQDIGLLNTQKAERSLQLWMSAISIPCSKVKCDGPLVAMDTFLCFYGAYWHEKTGSVYEEAIKHLTTMATKEGYMYFYLSMVYALMGKGVESSKMYQKFLFSAIIEGTPPGSTATSHQSSRNKKPWQPLVDKVKEQEDPPKPMKVVWRTQFVPQKCVDRDLKNEHNLPQEADICSRNLNLRISENGFLTGDMQMVLPPIRGVYLDLYTGKLNLPQIPSSTEGWKSYDTNLKCYNNYRNVTYNNKDKMTPFYLPTPTELYRGPNGETVQMIHTSINNVTDITDVTDKIKTYKPHLCHLMWTGSNGQKAKINVFHRMQWFLAEELQRQIKRGGESEEEKAEQIKLITKYINKGWCMTIQKLKLEAKYNVEKRKSKGKKKSKYEKREDRKSRCQIQNYILELFSVVDYSEFRLGLALAIKVGDNERHLMIVNCSSKEKFRKPVIITYDDHADFCHFAKQTPKMAKESDVFCVKTNKKGYLTYNVEGELVNDNVRTMTLDSVDNTHFDPVTYSSNIFYLTEDKRLCRLCFGCDTNVDFLGEITSMASIADILVMVTKDGAIKFVDIAMDLAPLDPIFNCSKPLNDSVWAPGQLMLRSNVEFSTFKVVGEATFIDNTGNEYTRGAIALDNHLLIVKIQRNKDDQSEDAVVTITLSLTLAGFPKEIHFINETAGFLLTVTQHIKNRHHYRENLYYYNHNGQLKQVLLCLGQGPRSFLTCYLPPDTDREYSDPECGREGRRVYMRDGHDGIICALLQ